MSAPGRPKRSSTSAPTKTAARARRRAPKTQDTAPKRILVVDIGGTKVKLLVSGDTEPRHLSSGPDLTPAAMVAEVLAAAGDRRFDAVSIGYPGHVGSQGPRSEPGNLGDGWVGFNYAAAFARPVRIINDAAMQALGSYEGGRMLFLGLGTGLGSALIAEHVVVPLELGGLHWGRRMLWQEVGRDGLKRAGLKAWRKTVHHAIEVLTTAFSADYVVLGGGNAKRFQREVRGVRISNNLAAFRGGFRLWNLPDVPTHSAQDTHTEHTPAQAEWRVI
jgi:polyphosphate glucokinase